MLSSRQALVALAAVAAPSCIRASASGDAGIVQHFPPPPPPFKSPGYEVLGSLDVDTGESTIFQWRGTMYILENIFCGYIDHFGKWNAAFKDHSYARIRELRTGKVVSNVSETVATSFVSIHIDLERDKAWLSALAVDRCKAQCGKGVLAISSADLISWTSSKPLPDIHTCNTQVGLLHPKLCVPNPNCLTLTVVHARRWRA